MEKMGGVEGSSSDTKQGVGRRILSFTFDDGLAHGAKAACDIAESLGVSVTFYVVTGWVEPKRVLIRERWNEGRWHGDWTFWRRMRDAGHEVGSHSFSHVNMGGKKARLMPWIVPRELSLSQRDLVREVPQDAYTISMPWNAATPRSERFVSSLFSACRLGGPKLEYNNLKRLDAHRLKSWAPGPDTTLDEYKLALDGIPEDGWLILQFHSFDDEGWEPLSRERFTNLCGLAAGVPGLEVLTVAEAVSQYESSAGRHAE